MRRLWLTSFSLFSISTLKSSPKFDFAYLNIVSVMTDFQCTPIPHLITKPLLSSPVLLYSLNVAVLSEIGVLNLH